MANPGLKRMQELRWAGHGSDWPEGHRPCMKCKKMLSLTEFHKHSGCRGGYNSVCKECRKPLSAKNYLTHTTQYKLWYRAKRRATERNQEFLISLEDVIVPDVCPVFKTPFVENTPYAASLDRKDSTKGYIKGNIQVISNRANIIKNDATLDELKALVQYMQSGVCDIL